MQKYCAQNSFSFLLKGRNREEMNNILPIVLILKIMYKERLWMYAYHLFELL
jgi:hypothetical protein